MAAIPICRKMTRRSTSMHWTGHTGCVIVAPHLAGMKKKDLGLPQEKEATDRQRRDGMFWRDPDEPYNGGGSFKVACRDERGVMVTIIADNYYGYCKKEVKTQISFAANLYGLCEEEHAGGAIAFATYVLGQDFRAGNAVSLKKARFGDATRLLGQMVEIKPEGYAVDRRYPNILYVPENSEFSVREGSIKWTAGGAAQRLTLERRCDLRASERLSPAHGKAIGRLGVEARWRASPRHAVPQALHRFRRRQIGNLEVHRQRHPRRTRFRRRFPP